ncbi:hypothetical protein B566_EDAN017923, partial [Ephemera danica]
CPSSSAGQRCASRKSKRDLDGAHAFNVVASSQTHLLHRISYNVAWTMSVCLGLINHYHTISMAQEEANPPVGGPFWQLVPPGEVDAAFRLPEAMIFVGREECDITVKARSVDKRHAVIMYDYCDKRFKVKDLNSTNGTFVNEVRIPVQTYIQLDSMDMLRFGFDILFTQSSHFFDFV